MKKALINPIDLIEGSPSVVSVNDVEFEATTNYYWVDCPDDTLSGMYYKDNQFYSVVIPPLPPTAEENQAIAIQKLKNTDWVEVPSVTATTSTPHLLNLNEWVTYRNQIRDYAINPVAGVIAWPFKPTEQWSK
jgi:hypothetical protein